MLCCDVKMSKIVNVQGSKILQLALSNKQIAVAVLGQALLDEGGIGSQSITIFYTSKGEAEHLWKIADSLGYANVFRKKKHRNHYQFGFSIIASKRRELYDQISPLPNPVKDQVFRHLAGRKLGKNIKDKRKNKNLNSSITCKRTKNCSSINA